MPTDYFNDVKPCYAETSYRSFFELQIKGLTNLLFKSQSEPKLHSQVKELFTSNSIFEIEGQWSAKDFSQLFFQTSTYYKQIIETCVRRHAYFLWEEGIGRDDKDRYYTALNYYKSFDFYNLQVKYIRYGSPGSIDFTGLGAALGHIKELILAYIPTKEQELKNEMYRLEIIKMTFDILRENNIPKSEINDILMNTEEFFGELGRNNKVKNILLDKTKKTQNQKG